MTKKPRKYRAKKDDWPKIEISADVQRRHEEMLRRVELAENAVRQLVAKVKPKWIELEEANELLLCYMLKKVQVEVHGRKIRSLVRKGFAATITDNADAQIADAQRADAQSADAQIASQCAQGVLFALLHAIAHEQVATRAIVARRDRNFPENVSVVCEPLGPEWFEQSFPVTGGDVVDLETSRDSGGEAWEYGHDTHWRKGFIERWVMVTKHPSMHTTEWSVARATNITLQLSDLMKLWPDAFKLFNTEEYAQEKRSRIEGRPKGSGGYDTNDEEILQEMEARVRNEKAAPWAIANELAERARGGGSLESRAKRLVTKYKRRTQNNSGTETSD